MPLFETRIVSSSARMATALSLLVASLAVSGCQDHGGGAVEEPDVVVIPEKVESGGDAGTSGASDTETGSDAVPAGGKGTLRAKVVMTGTLPPLPLPLLHAKGAAVKDAVACSKQDVPDERLIVNTENGNGVQNVFVYLARAPKGVEFDPPPETPVTYDQISCRYVPHCAVVRVDQPVAVLSDDEVPHNVHTYPLANTSINQVVPPKEREGKLKIVYTRPEKLPLAVKCDYHTWMVGYHLPVDHPFAAVTDENGEIEIPDMPSGNYEFVVWHEAAGYVHRKFKLTVKPGEPELQTIEFPADKVEL